MLDRILHYFPLAFFMCLAVCGQTVAAEEMQPNNFERAELTNFVSKDPQGSLNGRKYFTLFMTGDVMTGRGIDQILPYPSDSVIYESYMKSAKGYVEIAEDANGPIPQPAEFSYVWGDALEELKRLDPDVRLINLETSVTASDDFWQGKGINYRMHPNNVPVLTVAKIDVCTLANNHVLDWGYAGLLETLETLQTAGLKYCGAGRNLENASAPAITEIEGKGRVIVFSYGVPSSGIPSSWAASDQKPGVNLVKELSRARVQAISKSVRRIKQQGDVVVASIHWGGNWGHRIPAEQKEFAHRLIDDAAVDVIHGHSSHHAKAIEVYKEKLILYGCGDFINDYEGISGYEGFRGDLSLMYFATLESSTGRLVRLQMIPTQMKRFRVNRASIEDAQWLKNTLNREGAKYGTRVVMRDDNSLVLHWGK
jgi:poly-gamma-glutamate capsule biosynthesis protein CapA/YwtB (metallophosphatase superfamily)